VLVAFAVAILASEHSAHRWPKFGKGVGDVVTFLHVDNTTILIAERSSYSLSYSLSGTTLEVSYSASSLSNGWIGIFPPNVYTTNILQYVSGLSGSVTFSVAGLSGTYYIYLVSGTTIVAQLSLSINGGGGGGSSASPSSSPAAGTTTSSSTTGNSATIQSWLNEHNTRRASYGVPALSWSTKLAAIAQNWAGTMASQSDLYHSGTYGVGENIAYGYASIPDVLVAWADNEKQYYDAATQQCNGGVCGHFTQVAWASSNLVGCGIANSAAGWPYYSCNYIRPGNCNNYNWQQTDSPCPYFSDSSLP